jgi:epoxyqueuosine reductase
MVSGQLRDEIQKRAFEAGFDAVGVTTPAIMPEAAERMRCFVDLQRHGEMQWLAENLHRRTNPKELWPDAVSIIVLGMNYGPENASLGSLATRTEGYISVYARGGDYHQLVKRRLKKLAGWIYEQTGHMVKVFVDTAPVMEKPLAEAAGIGWQGKHTNLVSRKSGSWLFIGSIFTTLPLEPSVPEKNHCGNCRKCLDICPTDAFPAASQIDARRCISYLTIEHKGHIAAELRRKIGNRIFGCDDCLLVCPWNKFAQASKETRFHVRGSANNPPLPDLLELNETTFRTRFAGSPIKRAGRDGFLRNVLIAAGNSSDKSLIDKIEPLVSDNATIVRAMAVWALARLCSPDQFASLRDRYANLETDKVVQNEWS